MEKLRFNTRAYLHYWVFQGLFIIGYMFHQTEEWDSRPLALFSLGSLLAFTLLPKFSDWIFLLLLCVCSYVNIGKFPDLANHSNLTLFIALFLIPYQILLIAKPEKMNFESLFKTLRYAILTLYFFAIFHKLNWDFINPEVSCANQKLDKYFFMIPESFLFIEPMLRQIMPYLGLIIEGAVPSLLFFSKTRGAGLIFLVVLHFTLAPMGFTDFSSFAMCLAWCFLDPQKMKSKTLVQDFKTLSAFIFLMAAVFGVTRYREQIETYSFAEGVLFSITYLPFLFRHLKDKHWDSHLSFPRQIPQIAFLIFFFLFGFSNYLGLRTAGTFSMFSNLVTEGETSNHMILGSNPFKFFNFQEDVVHIIEPGIGAGSYRRMPNYDQKIPVVEFDRILDKYRERDWRDLDMIIRYKDKILTTEDAGFDKNFDFDIPYWQKKLLKFRYIQKKGPQRCLW